MRDHPDDDLRALLRRGDPAADGSEPRPEESAALRRVVLRGARTTPPLRWLPLAGAAAAAALAAALLLPEYIAPSRAPSVADESPAARLDDEPEERRQIRFATENGTQIIWVLDPDLEL